jgi:integrase
MRVSEVVGATWAEFQLDGVDIVTDHDVHHDPRAGNWVIPRTRMKRKDEERGPHIVPLPPVLLRTIKEWRAADGNAAKYVFVAPRDTDQHITPEGLEKFYRIALGLAGRHSPHSWRAAFSTICREAGKQGEVIESHLDHVVGTKIESAYDRSARLELRRALMRWYENKLIAARDGAHVIALSSVKS